MCFVVHYRDFHCKHRWAMIALPCYPGLGFDTCPVFVDGQVRPLPPRKAARAELCPECDLHGSYDPNQVRMVTKIRYGYRWGLGPNETDPGHDFSCGCSVM